MKLCAKWQQISESLPGPPLTKGGWGDFWGNIPFCFGLRRVRSYLTAFGISLAFLGAALESLDAGTIAPEPGYPILREVQYAFTLQNKTTGILKGAEFWTYAPVKLNSTQKCIKLEVSHPHQLIMDDLGNQILYFRFANLPPHAFEIITIKASLGLSDIPNPVPTEDVRSFLRPEKLIESDHPELLQMAGKFESATPPEIPGKIFRWVAENISYVGYLRDSRGALYALRNRRGDCTEYMSLFAALCRAKKIPARGIGGYVCKEDSILKPGSYHNWAEFYEANAWRIADPQEKVFMDRTSDYISMRIIGESSKNPMGEFNRFRSSGIGLEVKMMH
jgi:hypothetical protein